MTSPDRAALADELLPCPFCSPDEGNPNLHECDIGPLNGGRHVWFCKCTTCDIELDFSDTAQAAVARWNTRSPSPYSGAAGEAVAWRYGRKDWNGSIWRFFDKANLPENFFEEPDDWIIEPLYTHPTTLPRDAERDANRKDAEEFCKGAFGPFVTDVSQYVQIVTELLEHASNRASVSSRDAERETIERELADCRGAVATIEANRSDNRTQNRNYAFYQGKVAALEFVLALPSIPPREGPLQSATEQADASRDHPVTSVADAEREATPHWKRRWPHDQPNGWNLDSAGFLKLVQENPLMWLALGRAKYLELRVDTRDGGFNLYDRDKKPLNPDDVIEAINKVRADFGDAASPSPTSVMPDEGKQK